jgi:hypothetical protein
MQFVVMQWVGQITRHEPRADRQLPITWLVLDENQAPPPHT